MHSITINLPDHLYHRLKERSEQANRSLEDELLSTLAMDMPLLLHHQPEQQALYEMVLDFLTDSPSPQDIIAFKLPETASERAKQLLQKERQNSLTANEAQELDFYVELGDFLGILRAKAQVQLKQS